MPPVTADGADGTEMASGHKTWTQLREFGPLLSQKWQPGNKSVEFLLARGASGLQICPFNRTRVFQLKAFAMATILRDRCRNRCRPC